LRERVGTPELVPRKVTCTDRIPPLAHAATPPPPRLAAPGRSGHNGAFSLRASGPPLLLVPFALLLPLALLPVAVLPIVALPTALLPLQAPAPARAESAEPELRVLLRRAASLDVAPLGGGAQPLDEAGRTLLTLAPGQSLALAPSGAGIAVRRSGSGADLQLPASVAMLRLEPLEPSGAALLALGERRYRGSLVVRREGDQLLAVNHIGLEAYLPSVVGSEMPASWPLEALSAQAVAARTYALSQRRPAAAFDVKATVASQMYRGVEAETASTRAAVARTRSQVLLHDGSLIQAVFHSSSGGSTENSGEMWTRQLPYLVSVPDFDHSSPVSAWQLRFSPDQLRDLFQEIDGAQRIEVLAASSSGRIRRARVIGPRGSLDLSGAELRQRLGLRSTLVRFAFEQPGADGPAAEQPAADLPADSASGSITRATALAQLQPPPPLSFTGRLRAPILVASGRGFGHGVGMSQWGAYAMALRGSGYAEILRHYYRGAELRAWAQP